MSEQMPGVPEGYRLKGLYWGHELRGGEWCLNEHGTIFAYNTQWVEHQKYQNNLLPVLERIEPPKEYEAVIVMSAIRVNESEKDRFRAGVEETLKAYGLNFSSVTLREKRSSS